MAENPYLEILITTVPVHNRDRSTAARYLRLNCPFCVDTMGSPDESGHLHFYLDNSISRCMRCQAWAYPARLFQRLGLTLPDTGPTSSSATEILAAIKKSVTRVSAFSLDSVDELPEIELPAECLAVERLRPEFAVHARVLKQIERWRLTLKTIATLRWYYCAPKDAFIFPEYRKGKLVFFSTRSLDGKFRYAVEGDFSKYGVVGNLEHPLKDSAHEVYLVEGPKDSAALVQEGFYAVHLFGHNPGPAVVERLKRLPQKKIVLFDADVTDHATEFALKHRFDIRYLPSGDPADFTGQIAMTLNEISQDKKTDPVLRQLRQKMRNPQVHTRSVNYKRNAL